MRISQTMIIAAVSFFSLTACGKKKAVTPTVNSEDFSKSANDWIQEPPKGCAVGTVAYNELTAQNSRSLSASAANFELGKSIKTELNALAKGYMDTVVMDDKASFEQKFKEGYNNKIDIDMFGARVVKTQQEGQVFHSLSLFDL